MSADKDKIQSLLQELIELEKDSDSDGSGSEAEDDPSEVDVSKEADIIERFMKAQIAATAESIAASVEATSAADLDAAAKAATASASANANAAISAARELSQHSHKPSSGLSAFVGGVALAQSAIADAETSSPASNPKVKTGTTPAHSASAATLTKEAIDVKGAAENAMALIFSNAMNGAAAARSELEQAEAELAESEERLKKVQAVNAAKLKVFEEMIKSKPELLEGIHCRTIHSAVDILENGKTYDGHYYSPTASRGTIAIQMHNVGNDKPGTMRVGLRLPKIRNYILTIFELHKTRGHDFYIKGVTPPNGKLPPKAEVAVFKTPADYERNPVKCILGRGPDILFNSSPQDCWIGSEDVYTRSHSPTPSKNKASVAAKK